MKKILIFILSGVLVISLTACGNGKKAQEAYDAIGNLSFSDETILTDEEKATLESLKSDREQALSDKDVEKLNSIKSEWESFSEPIKNYIDKYEIAEEMFFSDDERALLTDEELSRYDSLKNGIDIAYKGRNEAELDEAIAEFDSSFGELLEIIETYNSIDQNIISEKEKSLLSDDVISEYENLKERTETALSERDLSLLKSLKSEWYSYSGDLDDKIEQAKEDILNDWVSSANVTSTLTTLFSLGTVSQSTSISGHTITYTTQYNTDLNSSDDQIKSAMDSYLSLTSSVFQSGVNYLKEYINDACIRVEYKNKNGSVVSYKEFR